MGAAVLPRLAVPLRRAARVLGWGPMTGLALKAAPRHTEHICLRMLGNFSPRCRFFLFFRTGDMSWLTGKGS